MNLNYAIFRSEPIMTLRDLAQIGSHNKREKKAYKSNPDIEIELSKNNIELIPLTEKYVKGFYNLTKDYRKEHEERMKTEREDRKRKFNIMLDSSRNVVADELLFTATNRFFRNMSNEDYYKYRQQYNNISLKLKNTIHDRFIIIDSKELYHCGASLKDLDKKCFAINKINNKIWLQELLLAIKD